MNFANFTGQWLTDKMKSAGVGAAKSVVYSRGTASVAVQAVPTSTLLKLDDGMQIRMEWTDRDWIIAAADLVLNGVQITPLKGDRIAERDENGVLFTTEVLAPHGEPVWRWADDAYCTRRLIHGKLVFALDPLIPAPAAPTMALAFDVGVHLTWNAVVGATSYRVFRGTVSGTYAMLGNNIIGTTYFDDDVLPPNTPYFYAVQAVGPGGTSAYSAELPLMSAPPIPTGLVSTSVDDSSVTMTWNTVAGAAAYYWLRGFASGVYDPTFHFTGPPPFQNTGLPAGTQVFYVVGSVNNDNVMSGHSAEMTATTDQ